MLRNGLRFIRDFHPETCLTVGARAGGTLAKKARAEEAKGSNAGEAVGPGAGHDAGGGEGGKPVEAPGAASAVARLVL